MTPEQWRQIKTLVEQALEQAPENRLMFLADACGNNEMLYQETTALICAEDSMANFLEIPVQKVLEKNDQVTTLKLSPQTITESSLPMGEYFLDKYELIRLIGKGGMGRVYQARHKVLGTMVAIKVLNSYLTQDEEAIERFKREARTAAQLEHPHTVRVFDYGAQSSTCYLVMEYLTGESLRERLQRIKKIDLTETLIFARQVCETLEAIHSRGIIHRDLKPDNIFFHRDDEQEIIKLLDFGIAKLNTVTQSGESLTAPGSIFGTPHYMSPEQCQGQHLDQRSDLYAVGIILYEMLAGRKPFEVDSTLSFMYAHVYTQPPILCEITPDVPPAISQVIMRLLAKSADNRYQSAQELLIALDDATNPILTSTKSSLNTTAANLNITAANLGSVTTKAETIKPLKQKRYYAIFTILALITVTSIFMLWRYSSLQTKYITQNITKNITKNSTTIIKPIHTTNDILAAFVLIEGGNFHIGRNNGDCATVPDCHIEPDESPEHNVTIAPYYLSKYEVTNQEYREFIIDTKHTSPLNWDGNNFPAGSENLPVTNVSWFDANDYCRWRSKRDGYLFRLPTEAEWEHAARGNDARLFPWGDIWDNSLVHANKNKMTSNSPLPIDRSPNNNEDRSPLGIFAMAGNVREWTSSDFQPYPNSKYRLRGIDLACKVLRGGSYRIVANGLRTTFRAWLIPEKKENDIGFRIAITPSRIKKDEKH